MIPAQAGGARSSGLVRTALPSLNDGARPGELALGRYVIHGEIASGGMASVYHGRLNGLGGFRREVAIKRLHRHLARDPEFVSMFLDEARLAARVVHPNVVAMLDVVSSHDETFLVMDYVPGVAFSQLLRIAAQRGERIPIGVATTVTVGMLRGLDAAHMARDERGEPLGIVHRDVSPQNVIVGTDGVSRLLDFGVAKAVVRLQTTRDGQVKGKSSYMAPEQVTGGIVTQKADIYAAAVVLWEALTGQRLYSGGTDANILFRVATETPRAPSSAASGIPEALDAIVLRGMARDPAARYASAGAMADDLERRVGIVPATRIATWLGTIAREALDERARQIAEFIEAQTATPVAGVAAAKPGTTGARAKGAAPSDEVPTTAERSATRARPSASSVADAGPVRASLDSQVPTRTLTAAEISDDFPVRRRRTPLITSLAILLLACCAVAAAFRARRATPIDASDMSNLNDASHASATPNATSAPIANVAAGSSAGTAATTASPASPAPTASATPTSALNAKDPVRVLSAPAPTPTATPHHRSRAAATAPAEPECVPYAVDAKGHTHFNAKCL